MSPLALSLRFLQTQSDAQLATLARAGHERAFEALVRRYRRPLLAYCRRVGSRGVNPEDTLQQALLQAWSAIRTGVEVRDPRAWLYRIVHNVAVSDQRRPALVPVELEETAGANGADHEAEQRMAARAALAGLAALPHLQREVMVGTAVDGLSHDELASALGLSSGAVRGLIYRARATLRAAAAAVLPAPVIGWALRPGSGRTSGVYEALGGSGSAGLGGILLKGGAIAATAGAIATAGISTNPRAAHHPASQASVGGAQHAPRQQRPASARTVLVSDTASSPTIRELLRGTSQRSGSRDTGGRDSDRSSTGFVAKRGSDGGREGASSGSSEHHDGSGPGSGHDTGGPSPSGGSSSGSGDRGPGGGSGGDRGDGLTTGGDGHGGNGSGGDLPGSDSGSSSSGSGSGGSGASHGGSGSDGSDGGGSATPASTPVTTATPDDGSDGSGHDGGGSTTSTTTVTTVTVPTTVDDDGGSGHQRGK